MTRAMTTWLSVMLLSMLSFACQQEASQSGLSDWEPTGSFDCHAELTRSEVALMAPVELTVRVLAGDQEELPLVNEIPQGFVGRADSSVVEHARGWLHTIVFHLRPTGLGEIKIAPFKIEQGEQAVTTAELLLQVVSTLGEGDDRVAVEGQSALQPGRDWWLQASVAFLVLLLLLGFFWWRRRPAPAVVLPVEVPVPAHVKALRALGLLQQPVTEAEVDRFYVEVSQVLRVYLEDRFGLHAPTRSTEEFLIELESGGSLGSDHRQSLRNFLQQCDLVKFARLHPDTTVHQQTLQVASTVVTETREDRVSGDVA